MIIIDSKGLAESYISRRRCIAPINYNETLLRNKCRFVLVERRHRPIPPFSRNRWAAGLPSNIRARRLTYNAETQTERVPAIVGPRRLTLDSATQTVLAAESVEIQTVPVTAIDHNTTEQLTLSNAVAPTGDLNARFCGSQRIHPNEREHEIFPQRSNRQNHVTLQASGAFQSRSRRDTKFSGNYIFREMV